MDIIVSNLRQLAVFPKRFSLFDEVPQKKKNHIPIFNFNKKKHDNWMINQYN